MLILRTHILLSLRAEGQLSERAGVIRNLPCARTFLTLLPPTGPLRHQGKVRGVLARARRSQTRLSTLKRTVKEDN